MLRKVASRSRWSRFARWAWAVMALLVAVSVCLADPAVSNTLVLKYPVPMTLGGYTGKALRVRPDLPEGMPLRASAQDLVVAAGFYPAGRRLAVFESENLLVTGSTASGGSQLRLARLPSGELVVLDCEGNSLRVTQIAGGSGHFVALLSDGRVIAWGENDRGQLGDGTRVRRAGPVLVQGVSGAVAVAAGYGFSLAVLSDGRVMGWGANDDGQLGDGVTPRDSTENDRLVPVYMKGVGGSGQLTGAVKVAAGGDHSLVLLSDGRVVACGNNNYGQLGDGTKVTKSYPAFVNNLTAVQDVAAGIMFSLALTKAGYVCTWGSGSLGELGDGSSGVLAERLSPGPVKAPGGNSILSGVVGIAARKSHALAVTSAGEVVAWGQNVEGCLGDGTTEMRTIPVFVSSRDGGGVLSGIASVAAGLSSSYAVTREGEVLAWGSGADGECGDGSFGYDPRTRPVWVRGPGGQERLSGVVAVAGGAFNACALLANGELVCWGNGVTGGLGNDTWTSSAVPVSVAELGGPCGYLTGVQQVAAGEGHSLALLSGGRVAAWGWNYHGQLGTGDVVSDGTRVDQASLVKGVGGSGQLENAVQVAAGGSASLALLSDGTVLGWGRNFSGELGDGTRTDRSVPVRVKDASGSADLSGVVQVAIGHGQYYSRHHSLAVLADGHLLAWGANDYGQLGNGVSGSNLCSQLPVKVVGIGGSGELAGVVQAAAGAFHSLALLTDGTVVAWGANDYGQLGDGTSGSGAGKAYPVRVRGLGGSGYLTGVVEVAASGVASFARLADGRVVSWGYKDTLGSGGTTSRSVPGLVGGINGSGILTGAAKIYAGVSHVAAVLSDGRAVTWGVEDHTPLKYPTLIKDAAGAVLSGVSGCAAGGGHTLLISSTQVLAYGDNTYGQVGYWIIYETNIKTPVLVRKKWPGR